MESQPQRPWRWNSLPQRRAKHGGSNQPPQRPENSGRFEPKIGNEFNEFNECGKPIFERIFFGGLGEMGKIQQNNMDNKNNVTVKLMQ